MSGSSNLVAMKKVVQQLRFEASIPRVKVILRAYCSVKYLRGKSSTVTPSS